MGNSHSTSLRRQVPDNHSDLANVSVAPEDKAEHTGRVEELSATATNNKSPDTNGFEDTPSSYQPLSEDPCQFRISLRATDSSQERNVPILLTFERFPRTGEDLKRGIERKLHIPLCVQTVIFNQQHVCDHHILERLCLRDGDDLTVEYSSVADIEYFSDLLSTLLRIENLVQCVLLNLSRGQTCDVEQHAHLRVECEPFTLSSLPLRYFSVFPSGIPNSNQLYFIHNGGLKLLVELYSKLHQVPWNHLPEELQEVEFSCLQIVWNFSATLGVRYLILTEGIMDHILKSLMRAEVRPYEAICLPGPLCDPFAHQARSTYILAESIYASVVIIGNLAEVPECRLPIASSSHVLKCMISAMLSKTYTFACARSGMCALLCLSFSSETHTYLSDETTLKSVLEIYHRTCTATDGTEESERKINQQLVGFFSLVFFASVLSSGNHQLVSTAVLAEIKTFMSTYLETATHTVITKTLDEKRYYWSTFSPFLSLVYLPLFQSVDLDATFWDLCVHTGLLSMKCMCSAENVATIVESEGLADYIVSSSWFMSTSETLASAIELTEIAQQKIRLQPPSLVNIVKAKLASSSCGLERVLHTDAYSLLVDLLQ